MAQHSAGSFEKYYINHNHTDKLGVVEGFAHIFLAVDATHKINEP